MKKAKLNFVLVICFIVTLLNVFSILNIIDPSVALGCNYYSDCAFCPGGEYCLSGGCCCYDEIYCQCFSECFFCGCYGSYYHYAEFCPGI